MKLTKTQVVTLSVTVLLTFSLLLTGVIWAGNLTRVLIVPFDINSEKDLSFLKRGVTDMLTTRLAQSGLAEPVNLDQLTGGGKTTVGPMNISGAVSQGKKYNAEYVIFGSVTVVDDRISTDAMVVDVSQQKPVLVFNKFGQSRSDLIGHISLLATQISEEVFGQKAVAEVIPPEEPAKAEKARQADALRAPGPEKVTEPYPAVPVQVSEEMPASWASEDFQIRMIGLAVGDLDGDGNNETAFAGDSKVYFYRYSRGKFKALGELAVPRDERILGIDSADINGNGKSEIFVTKLTEKKGRLRSVVVEWDGSQFSTIAEDLNWYFRIIKIPGRGNVLLGQEGAGLKKMFSGGVYEMKWRNGRYEPGQKIKLPKDATVYGFTFGDVLNDGKEMLIQFNPYDYVRVLDGNGNDVWESPDKYGGSTVYVEYPTDNTSFRGTQVMKRVYLKQRIIAADLNENGKEELVLIKNEDVSGRVLKYTRVFKTGCVEGFEWDGKGFTRVWKSKEFTEYISDYTVADFNSDGKADEVVLAVVAKGGSLFVKDKSYIYVYRVGS